MYANQELFAAAAAACLPLYYSLTLSCIITNCISIFDLDCRAGDMFEPGVYPMYAGLPVHMSADEHVRKV